MKINYLYKPFDFPEKIEDPYLHGRWLSFIGEGNKIYLYEIDDSYQLQLKWVKVPDKKVWFITISPSGKYMGLELEHSEGTLVWDLHSGDELYHVPSQPEYAGTLYIEFEGQELLIWTHREPTINAFDLGKGELVFTSNLRELTDFSIFEWIYFPVQNRIFAITYKKESPRFVVEIDPKAFFEPLVPLVKPTNIPIDLEDTVIGPGPGNEILVFHTPEEYTNPKKRWPYFQMYELPPKGVKAKLVEEIKWKGPYSNYSKLMLGTDFFLYMDEFHINVVSRGENPGWREHYPTKIVAFDYKFSRCFWIDGDDNFWLAEMGKR